MHSPWSRAAGGLSVQEEAAATPIQSATVLQEEPVTTSIDAQAREFLIRHETHLARKVVNCEYRRRLLGCRTVSALWTVVRGWVRELRCVDKSVRAKYTGQQSRGIE